MSIHEATKIRATKLVIYGQLVPEALFVIIHHYHMNHRPN